MKDPSNNPRERTPRAGPVSTMSTASGRSRGFHRFPYHQQFFPLGWLVLLCGASRWLKGIGQSLSPEERFLSRRAPIGSGKPGKAFPYPPKLFDDSGTLARFFFGCQAKSLPSFKALSGSAMFPRPVGGLKFPGPPGDGMFVEGQGYVAGSLPPMHAK